MGLELRCYFGRVHEGEIGGCCISFHCTRVIFCDVEVFWVVFNFFYLGMPGHGGVDSGLLVGTELCFLCMYIANQTNRLILPAIWNLEFPGSRIVW